MLGDRDLAGKTAIVTGGYSGLGLETTRALAGAGCRVVVPARRPSTARQELADLDTVEVGELDLADLQSVRSFAAHFLARDREIDIVIDNAGVMACPETRVGPGWEAQFATNHLGHYALVNLLWPAIARAEEARVVAVASGPNPFSRIRWDDPHFTEDYDKWQAYSQSKRANVLFAAQLDVLGAPAGVRTFAVNPGYILTPLQRHLAKEEMVAAGWVDQDGNPLLPEFKTPAQGAATQVWAATSPRLAGEGGAYCEDCDIVALPDPAGTEAEESLPEQAARLWAMSAGFTGVDAFATTG